jgi:hypothetical protein
MAILVGGVSEFELGYKGTVSYLRGQTPAEDPVGYAKDSPVLNASRQGAHAGRHQRGGTLSDFWVFEREGHGLALTTSQFVAGQAQIEWFRNHLGHD